MSLQPYDQSTRLIAAPHPFKAATIDRIVPDGLTLAEMVELSQIDPVLLTHAHIHIGDQYIPRYLWRVVRPKAGTTITLRAVPTGGGGGGKNPLTIVLMIAVIAASFYLGPMLGAALGGISESAAATTMVFGSLSYAALGTGIVMAVGSVLVSVIAPVRPPSLAALSGTSTTRDSPTLFIEGARNSAQPFGTVPVVLGKSRMVPPLGALTYTEVVGDDNYLRMLVVWGYGPLKIEDIKIGETPITEFDNYEIETREGRPDDEPLTLYPGAVAQNNFSVLVTQASDWQTRVAQPDADQLSVDITFGNGLVKFNNQGGRERVFVTMEIQYRKVGDSAWSNLPAIVTVQNTNGSFTEYSYEEIIPETERSDAVVKTIETTVPAAQLNIVNGELQSITIQAQRTGAIRHGFRWKVPTRGNYEVRMRRTTTDSTDTQTFDQFAWTALRAITNIDPIAFKYPLAKTAISIKATDQLNGVIDDLNAIVSSYVVGVDGTETVSSNPADLYRHVLQGNANAGRKDNDEVDLDKLQDWYAFNVAHGFEFNMVRDFQASVWDTLADIASAGRGSPAQVDGKWTVVYDDKQTVPVQHFTPRNSWAFEAGKDFPEQPDALRIRFNNRNLDWRQDERVVYADGFDESNAEKFSALEGPGITDPDHIWKFGRFSMAQHLLRPEKWNFNADFEHIVARRGDLITLTHDVLLVGLASGRIKSLITDGGSPEQVTGFVSDEVLKMEAGKDYGVSIRTVVNARLTSQIVTSAGSQTEITFTAPIALDIAPEVGDLFSFGVLGQETIDGLLLGIERTDNLSARLTCVPASPEVYDSDKGTIPPFDSKLTPLPAVPLAQITQIRSDESILQLGAGNTLVPHIGVSVAPVDIANTSLDVQIRVSATGERFYAANIESVQGLEYRIGGVEQGTSYDVRVRWNVEGRLPGKWTTVFNHRVIGEGSLPAALINPTISVFGGSALIRWDAPAELDVKFGGVIRFRHSPELDPDLATWSQSTSIGTTAQGDALVVSLPLKPGTYLVRVFDKGGRPSPVIKLATKQASVLAFANVDSITESPTFSGNKTNVIYDDESIKLIGAGLFDDIPDLDEVVNLDSTGGVALSGTYDFAAGFDFETVKRVRLTSRVVGTSLNVLDLIDNRAAPIDSWEDFDGTEQAAANARVQVRHTDDDPNDELAAWSIWNDLDSAEFEARAFDFKVILTTEDAAFNMKVTELKVFADEIAA